MCKHCNSTKFIRFGCYYSRSERIQRYRCRGCGRTFSKRLRVPQYYDRRPQINQALLIMLCSGVSQRRCALILKTRRKTIARKIQKYGAYLRLWHVHWLRTQNFSRALIFDEMETFEHTKCKPLSLPIAVEDRSRLIIGIHVASMPAKGKLAKIAQKRYGPRKDDRPAALQRLMNDMLAAHPQARTIKSDQAPRYPRMVARNFPKAKHQRFKGRRGCVVGQGELKAGGYDPLFFLNHNCAMVRDNLKRLTRRTWCTTKKPEQLQNLLNIYTVFHNRQLGSFVNAALPPPQTTLLGAS